MTEGKRDENKNNMARKRSKMRREIRATKAEIERDEKVNILQ